MTEIRIENVDVADLDQHSLEVLAVALVILGDEAAEVLRRGGHPALRAAARDVLAERDKVKAEVIRRAGEGVVAEAEALLEGDR